MPASGEYHEGRERGFISGVRWCKAGNTEEIPGEVNTIVNLAARTCRLNDEWDPSFVFLS